MAVFLFILLSLTCIGSILGMILSKNQAHSALYLILAFVCTGGLFGLMSAPFIAAVQIIIYAGAIMVLFIFVIMMIDIRKGLSPERKKWILYPSLGIGLVLIIELIFILSNTLVPSKAGTIESFGSPKTLGKVLFTKYLYPFEITSVLIIAALVGAIVLVKKKEEK
ncbi:MAG: NADH-quinone oxidoreductase subunit J [Candidatus Aminicenantes bacterium]|nr:NADH-quinone oxidoreductase subunit J [Candidatus Aminicenantes bacterium]